jgi:hypothetical protein
VVRHPSRTRIHTAHVWKVIGWFLKTPTCRCASIALALFRVAISSHVPIAEHKDISRSGFLAQNERVRAPGDSKTADGLIDFMRADMAIFDGNLPFLVQF